MYSHLINCCFVHSDAEITPIIADHHFKSSTESETQSHTDYLGIDLQAVASVDCEIDRALSGDSSIIRCDTSTQGRGDVWCIETSGALVHLKPNFRFVCSTEGMPLFVRSTCMIGMKQACHGSLIVYKESTSKEQWYLGVVSGMFYNRPSVPPKDVLHVYMWNGDLALFECDNPDSILSFFSLMTYDLSRVKMFFVNQVCSVVFRLFL